MDETTMTYNDERQSTLFLLWEDLNSASSNLRDYFKEYLTSWPDETLKQQLRSEIYDEFERLEQLRDEMYKLYEQGEQDD